MTHWSQPQGERLNGCNPVAGDPVGRNQDWRHEALRMLVALHSRQTTVQPKNITFPTAHLLNRALRKLVKRPKIGRGSYDDGS